MFAGTRNANIDPQHGGFDYSLTRPPSLPLDLMPESSLPSIRVLVVEDSVVNQKLLTHLLADEGYDVTIASNGKQAVEQYQRQVFDVVLMDVQMPVMDGLTATKLIRSYESGTGQRAVIVAVTAGVDRESCLQAGMDDHLHKPVRPEVLREIVEQVTNVG